MMLKNKGSTQNSNDSCVKMVSLWEIIFFYFSIKIFFSCGRNVNTIKNLNKRRIHLHAADIILLQIRCSS